MSAEIHHHSAKPDMAAELTPAFPPLPFTDGGFVRIGGQAPLFQPEMIADAGLVRIGGQSPMF